MVKSLPASVGDADSLSGLGRSSGGGNGSPLRCSCLGNPMDRGAWRATVHGVAQESYTSEGLSTHVSTLDIYYYLKANPHK